MEALHDANGGEFVIWGKQWASKGPDRSQAIGHYVWAAAIVAADVRVGEIVEEKMCNTV